MDENLQRLARGLRAERCPPHVLEKVQARISWKTRSPSRLWVTGSFGVSALVILALLVVVGWPGRKTAAPSLSAVSTQADRVRVAEQTGAALGYVGLVLIQAGKQTKTILLNEAAPPVRRGLEAARESIKNKR